MAMPPPSRDGAMAKILLGSSLMIALVITAQSGGQFYAASAPYVRTTIAGSDLFLFEGLLMSLFYLISWPAFFLLSFSAVHLTLTLILGFLLSKFLR